MKRKGEEALVKDENNWETSAQSLFKQEFNMTRLKVQTQKKVVNENYPAYMRENENSKEC